MKILFLLAFILFAAGVRGAETPVPPVQILPIDPLESIFPDDVDDYKSLSAEGTELDVPYVPTPMNVVHSILELGRVGPGDVLYDLGCGDGRIVIAAAEQFGVRGVGVDLDPRRIEESNANAAAAGVEELVEFRIEDIFETDFREATVVAIYLLPSVNLRLRPHLLEQLRPGSRVVSHQFHMGEWKEDHHLVVDGRYHEADLYLWLIPAPVEGEWSGRIDSGAGPLPFKLFLERQFQQFWGTIDVAGVKGLVAPGTLRGTGLVFDVADFTLEGEEVSLRFLGEVDGDRASGLVSIDNGRWTGVFPWSASRFRQPEDEGRETDE